LLAGEHVSGKSGSSTVPSRTIGVTGRLCRYPRREPGGYVELAEGLLVEGLIVGATASDLRIGQSLVSTTTTLDTADGQSFLTFAFRPA
jgi:hypothetical protein